ncbi:MAG: hypothetical protein DRZ76_03665, partial [Candidatus Nealsonbacteria bacterium]
MSLCWKQLNRRLLKLGLLIGVLVLVWFGLRLGAGEEILAAQGINQQINYQGKLSDSSGVAVADDTYNVKFVIYDGPGAGANCLWTAVGSCADGNYGTTTVTTVNGVFSVVLGGTGHNSLATSSIDWNSDSLYLGVTVRGTVASPVYDSEMSPRKRITSSAYAFNTDTVDGIHASTTAQVDHLLALDSSLTFNLATGGVSSTRATTSYAYFVPQTSAPEALEGRFYYHDTDNTMYFYDGSSWQSVLGGSGGGGAAWQATSTDKLGTALVGTSPWITPTTTASIYAPQDLFVDGNATTSGYLMVGNGTVDYLDYAAGDLYVADDLEVDGSIVLGGVARSTWPTGGGAAWEWIQQAGDNYLTTTSTYPIYLTGTSRLAGLNATTTKVDTLHIFTDFTTDDTGLVVNLNADLLDSQQGSYYTDASNLVIEATDDWTGLFGGQDSAYYLNWDNFTNKAATSTILSLLDSDYRIATLNATNTNIDTLNLFKELRTPILHATTTDLDTLVIYDDARIPVLNATSTLIDTLTVANATTTNALEIGTGGTIDNLDMSSGDLYVADDLEVDSILYASLITSTSVTSTAYIFVGSDFSLPESFDYAGDLAIADDLVVGDLATVTAAFWVGSAGTADNLDLTAGDLYIQDSLEVDGTAYFGRTTSTQATTTDYLWLGGWASLPTGFDLSEGDLYVADDLFVGSMATITDNLVVSGYASTTNLVLSDDASNLGTYYDLYVNSGDLFFDGTQITGANGLSFWSYAWDKVITPTSTDLGIFVTASSTIAADFRVDGNATTTGDLYVGDSLRVATTTPWSGVKLAVEGDIAFGRATTTDRIYVGGANSTSTFAGNVEIVGNLGGGSPLDVVTDLITYGTATITDHFEADGTLYVKDGKVGVGTESPS